MREICRRCSTLQMSQNWLKDASRSESYWFLKFAKDKLLGCITKRSIDAVVDNIFGIVGAGSITISYQ